MFRAGFLEGNDDRASSGKGNNYFMDDAITPPGLTNMVSVLKYNHKGVTDDGWPRLVIQKSNLTLVVAVAFLLYVSRDAYACL